MISKGVNRRSGKRIVLVQGFAKGADDFTSILLGERVGKHRYDKGHRLALIIICGARGRLRRPIDRIQATPKISLLLTSPNTGSGLPVP